MPHNRRKIKPLLIPATASARNKLYCTQKRKKKFETTLGTNQVRRKIFFNNPRLIMKQETLSSCSKQIKSLTEDSHNRSQQKHPKSKRVSRFRRMWAHDQFNKKKARTAWPPRKVIQTHAQRTHLLTNKWIRSMVARRTAALLCSTTKVKASPGITLNEPFRELNVRSVSSRIDQLNLRK